MKFSYCSLCFLTFFSTLGLLSTQPQSQTANARPINCPIPVLARIQRHQVSPGETLAAIASRYHLAPETIIAMNPSVSKGVVTAGTILQIPPFNGMVVEIPAHQSWRQIASKYQVLPDTVFEINGCQKNPKFVFLPVIPGVKFAEKVVTKTDIPGKNTGKITGYPLPNTTSVTLGYGWNYHPVTKEAVFHSGVDLLAPVGTPVVAIAPGIVVFAKEQGSYGKLVIINHADGLQSRYAQLDGIKVTLGQKVNQGHVLGTVGTTGQPTSIQPHLHFEIRVNGFLGWEAKDPKGFSI
ncbi:M23 family metallopeptidase [Dolichospermum circinale CS-1225]|uniref:M23 family metallopeptidase n=1 Tax=Dolichospermum circinale CS-537/01 TaxID=3021739 RepID=A0ABT5A651_9CYAN|nr:M23 family metallopeptidase [Dolichospermum circinale]MDB9459478.1 M23 family metallopeptidase [Dolichospermum circinale CS-545/17]MDB9468924.1 M23 family metallopeptidase [Dolichospermum circinale CS-539/09]MDB9469387.1 M23 family metallopeptidase [Dolichospermum circinale CS-539]MDB9487431.1 M23 family metallopeptidase [Dolichospermum circinale CS-537/01]MDB9520480.1 M23 family metallopeptidase [Dolichospermum circinale CS-1225]